MFLYVIMLVIATLGPMGPMNSFYGATSRIMLAMGRKGQLPEKFAEIDPKSGAPKMANMLLACLTSRTVPGQENAGSADQCIRAGIYFLLHHGELRLSAYENDGTGSSETV